MNGWNPFGKVDMEIGSFLKASVFNKEYENENEENNSSDKNDENNTSNNNILNNENNDSDFSADSSQPPSFNSSNSGN
ncbi:MAG: hypothetical protein ACYDG2_19805 [Ruminiclostridium sp.]